MPSFEHEKLVNKLNSLNEVPTDQDEFYKWISASEHLSFLKGNAVSDELIIYAGGGHNFIHADIISNEALEAASEIQLLDWSGTPYRSIASYVSGMERGEIWLESYQDVASFPKDSKGIFAQLTPLVFARTFEGWSDSERNYFEINQEFTHAADIHWRPEERAYCRFDKRGDLEHVISITGCSSKPEDAICVSLKIDALNEYLVATNSSLIRKFDFTLLRYGDFSNWPDGPESMFREQESNLIYRQKVDPEKAAYTTGVQILTPNENTVANVYKTFHGESQEDFVTFTAYDWRNKKVTDISTHPDATTNYFEAEGNNLPFELSAAFFRPEVMSKYKTDKDKYQIRERSVTCRSAWYLKSYDINKAGQVFAYICDLQRLPYEEQLHWKAFNEDPKASISARAITNDFKGEFVDYSDSLTGLLAVLNRWDQEKVSWWKLRDEKLPDRVSAPISSSVDEWSDSFMDLAMLLVEGFQLKVIRGQLDRLEISYEKNEQNLKLLKRLLSSVDLAFDSPEPSALQIVQLIRTKVKGHATGTEATKLIKVAKEKYGNLPKHFKSVCADILIELSAIEELFLAN